MKGLREDNRPARGLRERKKAKTKAAIQHHALRLFRERGYEATTVEQIADAAEVSPSTFFRYFPTKEDVVLYDDIDPLFVAAFEAQPSDLSPIQALRAAIRGVFATLPPEEMAQLRDRARLILTVPELRMRMLDQLAGTIDLLAEMMARRVGRRADEVAVRTAAGAVIGAWIAVFLAHATDPQPDYVALLDASLAQLEAGLSL